MKNILILTDFSENSWNSIEYSLALSKNKSYNFYLLNSSDNQEDEYDESIYGDVDLLTVKITKNSKRDFDKLLNKIAQSPLKGEHNFEPIIVEKNLLFAVRNQIKEKNIDLIVMGTNGLSSQGKMNIGTITEDIITKVKCSTLVVPKDARFNSLKEIAFPTDFTYFYEAKLLQNISNLFSYVQSNIRFVYLSKKDEKLNKEQNWNKETLKDFFKEKPHSFHSEINENFESSIEKIIDKMGIDLIIMAAKNLNLFEQILFRPKIKTIKYYSQTPFLILH